MSAIPELGRLNVLLEFIGDCAAVLDEEALRRLSAGRLRWVLAFERCSLALYQPGDVRYLSGVRQDDSLREVPREALPAEQLLALDAVLRSGVPSVNDSPASVIAYPLRAGERSFGALCLAEGTAHYDLADMRYAQQAADHLAAALLRIEHGELQRSTREKDEFFALLGHELRNPLAPILSAVSLLKRGDLDAAPLLAIVERQAQHLVRLVDDLLDVARVTRAKLTLDKVPLELALVVRLAVERAAPLLEERRHRLTLEVPQGLRVNGDQARLEQVVGNLLINSARYTEPGGSIRVRGRSEGAEVVLEVEDDGEGIAPAELGRIFDPFYQASARPGAGSLGLGLSLVRSLTLLHGGSVLARSRGPGSGSTFEVRLPALAAQDSVPPAAPRPRKTARPARVLVVDDNADAALTLAAVLRADGHEAFTAHAPDQALVELERCDPEVVILDIGLPVMDGYALAREIAQRRRAAVPHLIALTGYGNDRDRARGREAGFVRYLVKPVDAPTLLETLAGVLD